MERPVGRCTQFGCWPTRCLREVRRETGSSLSSTRRCASFYDESGLRFPHVAAANSSRSSPWLKLIDAELTRAAQVCCDVDRGNDSAAGSRTAPQPPCKGSRTDV